MPQHPLAGQPAPDSILENIPRLVSLYYSIQPDPEDPAQRVAFGTSGHRGCARDGSFNEAHILAISQAVCEYRAEQGIDGPLFLGIDTHALSEPALISAVEVFAANGWIVPASMDDVEALAAEAGVRMLVLTHFSPRYGDEQLFADFRASIARKTRGFLAPEYNIRCIEAAANLPFDEGLKVEGKLFMELMTGPQSGAQRYAFFAERAANKIPDIPKDTPLVDIQTCGVLGAGTMGGNLADHAVGALVEGHLVGP